MLSSCLAVIEQDYFDYICPMPVTPKPATEQFCDFILLEIVKKLTTARKQLVQDVRTAAINQTTVTDQDWENFLLTSYQYYTPYQVQIDFKT